MGFIKKTSKPKGLHIIIVGCGKVGITLVEQLSKEGHDITIVDKTPGMVQEIASQYDVMGVAGNGASYSVLMDAGIESADLIIAVTDSDELNLLCCTVAKQVGDDCATIARVRTPDYSKEARYLREKLGLTMVINPELEASLEMTHILCLPTALEVNSFTHGQVQMIKFKIPSDNILDGMTVAQLGQQHLPKVLVGAVEHEGVVTIPSGNYLMHAGDIITFVASRKDIRSFLKSIGFQTKQVKNTMIVGGGRAAYYLANQLLRVGIDVKIIERDEKRCEELSILLPKAVIINGDGTDQEILNEEGLKQAESFVALTGIDEENIMLTLHAAKFSNAKVITKINRSTFKDIINSLDLGSVIYPRYITCEAIIAYVRAKKNSMDSNIETLYHLFDNRVEAIEFHVDEKSAVTDIPLMNLKLKKNLLVAFIYHNGKTKIPNGQDKISVGDHVMIVTTHSGFNDILDILEK
jgi:trk system potassium uptake protein TrkA